MPIEAEDQNGFGLIRKNKGAQHIVTLSHLVEIQEKIKRKERRKKIEISPFVSWGGGGGDKPQKLVKKLFFVGGLLNGAQKISPNAFLSLIES